MKSALTVILILITFTLWAQHPYLNKSYGSLTGNSGYSLFPVENGYLVVSGGYSATFNNFYGLKIFRVDSLGNELWLREYGKERQNWQTFNSGATKYSDGGVVLTGQIADSVTMKYIGLIIRLDSIGDTIWTKQITGIRSESLVSCVELGDGSIAATGISQNMGDADGDVVLMKVDAAGQTIWRRKYGGGARDIGYNLALMPDKGFLIGGYTRSSGPGTTNNYLIRTDSVGNTVWQRTYGTAGDNGACLAYPAADGGIIMWGNWDTLSTGYGCDYISKLDSVGNIQWIKFYPYGTVAINRVRELPNGDIIAVGQRDEPDGQIYGGYINCLDPYGNTKWERLIEYRGSDIDTSYGWAIGTFYDFKQLDAGGFALTGVTTYRKPGAYYNGTWLVVTDSSGCAERNCIGTGVAVIIEHETLPLAIHPNPSHSTTTLTWQASNHSQPATVTAYDPLGREIHFAKLDGDTYTLNVSGWQAGLYLVRVVAGDSIHTGKLLVE